MQPISDVAVQVLDRAGTQVAVGRVQPDGTFAFPLPHSGEYRVVVRRVGYAVATGLVELTETFGVRLAAVLAPQTVYLESGTST